MILNNSKKNILALSILFVLMGCTQNSKLSEWSEWKTEENISVMTGDVDYVGLSPMNHSFSSKNIMNMNYAYSLERENYAEIKRNGLVVTKENPVSTFSIDTGFSFENPVSILKVRYLEKIWSVLRRWSTTLIMAIHCLKMIVILSQ